MPALKTDPCRIHGYLPLQRPPSPPFIFKQFKKVRLTHADIGFATNWTVFQIKLTYQVQRHIDLPWHYMAQRSNFCCIMAMSTSLYSWHVLDFISIKRGTQSIPCLCSLFVFLSIKDKWFWINRIILNNKWVNQIKTSHNSWDTWLYKIKLNKLFISIKISVCWNGSPGQYLHDLTYGSSYWLRLVLPSITPLGQLGGSSRTRDGFLIISVMVICTSSFSA
jgi:hypothetical protein